MNKRIGLFFGSFNPIHVGHLIIANAMAQSGKVDVVWFVVSPQNPFKEQKSLLNQYDRLHLARVATENNPLLSVSDIEFALPKPSYTIDTLTYLQEKYPDHSFCILMGSDNLKHFHKWKNYEQILKYYELVVYPRPGEEVDTYEEHPHVHQMKVPLLDISATYIRKLLKADKDIRYLVPDKVYSEIERMNLAGVLKRT